MIQLRDLHQAPTLLMPEQILRAGHEATLIPDRSATSANGTWNGGATSAGELI